ncbi:thioesterase II family protein [Flavobacterium branchiicola]|uniref:Thioesterase II family protein n=1 Tax=Flavobacterium branchiicola TaxID=1114875 RepID=A0ABV9PKD7_9FLAO|nr:alpha/beta fold hydrolase [Flavobacterium branchiicola]MBS7256348.1 thioesterase [Flavobacterium branchiicola]
MENRVNKFQLFLLHFAGGSSYSFDFLKKEFDADIEFIALELPGRGKRFEEKLLKSKQLAIADYCKQIISLSNGSPFIIYGHSMGASLGLRVVSELERAGYYPKRLIVTGNAGPGVQKKENVIRYLLDDFHFKEELRNLGGIPEEVLTNTVLYDFFAPIMRADFECIEKKTTASENKNNAKLQTPIYAMMGSEEECCNEITNWRNFTSASFEYKILKGNHFFIYNHVKELTTLIKKSFLTEMHFQEL